MLNENPISYSKHYNWSRKLKKRITLQCMNLQIIQPQDAEFANCTHGRLIIMSNTRDLKGRRICIKWDIGSFLSKGIYEAPSSDCASYCVTCTSFFIIDVTLQSQ